MTNLLPNNKMIEYIFLVVVVFITAIVLRKVFDGKCEFAPGCEHYSETSVTCNKDAGRYYADGYCGTFRKKKGW